MNDPLDHPDGALRPVTMRLASFHTAAEQDLRVTGNAAVPFDAAAASYDSDFTATQLARWLREAVWEVMAAAFAPGDRVLELGCGTGEDALWLAQRGVHVTASDASHAMLEVARRKVNRAGVADRVDLLQLDLATVDAGGSPFAPPVSSAAAGPGQGARFDGAFSNFGPLNCLADRRPLAEGLARWIKPGGAVILVVMGPACPWEIGWHLLHGQPRAAMRRFQGGVQARVGDGATIPVWYPSPRTVQREFAGAFDLRAAMGIGSALPPSYLAHLATRWPAFFGRLAALDRRISRSWPAAWLNDHYLLALERRR